MLYRDQAGIGRYVWELQRALADLPDRHERQVTLLLDPRDALRCSTGITTQALAVPARHPLERVTMGLALRRFDTAHFPDHALPDGVRVPSVVTVHDVSFLTHPSTHNVNSRVFYSRAMSRLRCADEVIAVSVHVRNHLLERRLVGAERLSVVAEAPTLAVDVAPHSGDPLSPFALMVGTIQPRKNHARAARAWLHTRASRDMRLFVVGALGYQGGDIVKSIRKCDPKSRVRFLGRVSDATLGRLYSRARLLLQPSLDEGFGLPVLEAMRAGLPCVAADIGALREITDGAAVYADPLDVEEMASAIDRVIDNPDTSKLIADAGRVRAAGFSWAQTAKATVAVYDRLR